MIKHGWMYDAIVYMYALSLLVSFSDAAHPRPGMKRAGTGLLAFVWLLQTALLVWRGFEEAWASLFTGFDALLLLSWLTIALSLALNRLMKMDLLMFIVNVIGFALAALNFFSDQSVSPTLAHWRVQDELLFVHVSMAMVSYALFTLAAVFSGAYLFLHKQLKRKKWTPAMQRVPSLERLERAAYACVVIGTPLLILALALGLVWIILGGQRALFADPKVLNSILVIAAYGLIVFQRAAGRAGGTRLAVWNMAAFALVIANFIVSNLLSGFHQWMWR